jgi:hypothetical protein
VPSLLDEAGELFTPAQIPELLARARLDEVEHEFRAQVDAGLTSSHLDWHCLADGGREDILDLTVALGEYVLDVVVVIRRPFVIGEHRDAAPYAPDALGAPRWPRPLTHLGGHVTGSAPTHSSLRLRPRTLSPTGPGLGGGAPISNDGSQRLEPI